MTNKEGDKMRKRIVIILVIVLMNISINWLNYRVYGAPAGAQMNGNQSGLGEIVGGIVENITESTNNTLGNGDGSLDKVMKGAEDFLKIGSHSPLDNDELKKTSNILFNILLGIAMIVAVIVGMIIGIRFMVASVDEKAKIKEQLLPYAVGCGVVFGAFGIWKLAITILATW